jgi:dolichol kinase
MHADIYYLIRRHLLQNYQCNTHDIQIDWVGMIITAVTFLLNFMAPNIWGLFARYAVWSNVHFFVATSLLFSNYYDYHQHIYIMNVIVCCNLLLYTISFFQLFLREWTETKSTIVG